MHRVAVNPTLSIHLRLVKEGGVQNQTALACLYAAEGHHNREFNGARSLLCSGSNADDDYQQYGKDYG
jgi:hypothetical protein